MPAEHPDLDGLRLISEGRPEVWLVYHGKRHLIANPLVYESLFGEADRLTSYDHINDIHGGPTLADGTILVRDDDGRRIYFVANLNGVEVRRHYISSWETFLDFGFDEAKVRNLPDAIIQALPEGAPLWSAAERALKP